MHWEYWKKTVIGICTVTFNISLCSSEVLTGDVVTEDVVMELSLHYGVSGVRGDDVIWVLVRDSVVSEENMQENTVSRDSIRANVVWKDAVRADQE